METQNNINKNFKKYFKLIVRILTLFAILIIMNNFFLFSGKITFIQDFSGSKSNISNLKPPNNISNKENKNYQVLTGDNANFVVTPPSKPNNIDLNIQIENPSPVINIYLPYKDGHFENHMVYNWIIETLQNNNEWQQEKNEDLGFTLWQKKDIPMLISEYSETFPFKDTYFGVNNYQFIRFPNYEPFTEYNNYNLPLRGSHILYTYIGEGEELAWRFNYKDVGKNPGLDPFSIRISSGNSFIGIEEFELFDLEGSVELINNDLPAGIYQLEIPMDNDLRLTSFDTRQKYFGITDKIDMDDHKTNSELYIIGDEMKFQTVHTQGKQTIYFNDQSVQIEKTRDVKEYNIFPTKLNELIIEKNDITIETDGVAVLNKENRIFAELLFHLFQDKIRLPDMDNIEYMISTNQYDKPITENENLLLQTNFDLHDIKLTKKDKIKFTIIAPHLRPIDDYLKFEEIKTIIYRPVIPYIKSLLNS